MHKLEPSTRSAQKRLLFWDGGGVALALAFLFFGVSELDTKPTLGLVFITLSFLIFSVIWIVAAVSFVMSALPHATSRRVATVGVGRHIEAKASAVGTGEWGYGRAIEGRLITAFVSATVTVRGLAVDERLVALTCDLYRKGRPILSLPLSDPNWLSQAKGPQIAQAVVFHRTFDQADYGVAPRVNTGDKLEPHIIAQFSIDRSTDRAILPNIPVKGPYQPGVVAPSSMVLPPSVPQPILRPIDIARAHENYRANEVGDAVVAAARLIRTELDSILARLRRLSLDPTLTEDYLLPFSQWEGFRDRIVAIPSAYDAVAAAYREIARINDQWRWRREGTKGRIAANLEDDGLDALRTAATLAIAALDQLLTPESSKRAELPRIDTERYALRQEGEDLQQQLLTARRAPQLIKGVAPELSKVSGKIRNWQLRALTWIDTNSDLTLKQKMELPIYGTTPLEEVLLGGPDPKELARVLEDIVALL